MRACDLHHGPAQRAGCIRHFTLTRSAVQITGQTALPLESSICSNDSGSLPSELQLASLVHAFKANGTAQKSRSLAHSKRSAPQLDSMADRKAPGKARLSQYRKHDGHWQLFAAAGNQKDAPVKEACLNAKAC